MPTPTPPLGDTAAWLEFTARVTALVRDADPLAILAQTADELHAVISAAPPQALHHTERPDGWSVIGVLEHLADAELVFGFRLRQVLSLDRPLLQSFDQDRWAALGRYNAGDAAAALGTFSALRTRHLAIWSQVTGDMWDRVGIHGDRGPESLRQMVRIIAGHDLAHRAQIARILGPGTGD